LVGGANHRSAVPGRTLTASALPKDTYHHTSSSDDLDDDDDISFRIK
jgi:hypothetical protein